PLHPPRTAQSSQSERESLRAFLGAPVEVFHGGEVRRALFPLQGFVQVLASHGPREADAWLVATLQCDHRAERKRPRGVRTQTGTEIRDVLQIDHLARSPSWRWSAAPNPVRSRAKTSWLNSTNRACVSSANLRITTDAPPPATFSAVAARSWRGSTKKWRNS